MSDVLDTPIDDVSFRIVDIEATGLSTADDELIEVAVYELKGGKTTLLLNTLVRPTRSLPERITELTGIEADELASAPPLEDVFERLRDALSGDALVAHNAASDTGYLGTVAWRFDPHWSPPPSVCTLKLSRAMFPDSAAFGLRDLAESLHLPLPAHRARQDALCTVRLLEEIVARANVTTLGELVALQQRKVRERPQAQISPLTVETLPAGPGIYRFFDDQERLLYVGYSVDVRRRVREHLYRALTPAAIELCRRARSVRAEATPTELDAYVREGEALQSEKPAINVRNAEHGKLRYFKLSPEGAVTLVSEPSESRGAIHLGPIVLRRAERNVLRAVREAFGLTARGDRKRADEHPGRVAFIRFIREEAVHADPILTELRMALHRSEAARLDALRPFRTATIVSAAETPAIVYALSAGRPTLRLDLESTGPDALVAWLAHTPEADADLDLAGRRISAYVRAHPARVRLEIADDVLFRLRASAKTR